MDRCFEAIKICHWVKIHVSKFLYVY
jgi:hypothetical protein